MKDPTHSKQKRQQEEMEGMLRSCLPWPTKSSELPADSALASTLMRFLGGLIGVAVGADVARSSLGVVGWNDELVAMLFGMGGFGVAHQFVERLCQGRPHLWKGVLGVAATGLSLGFGVAALTAAALVSWIDGGLITGSIVVPASWKMIVNARGGTKTCPHCNRKQSCKHAVCRNCLRIFFPAPKPDCSIFFLDWFAIASFLHDQGLNYFEARTFMLDKYPHQPKGGKIDCSDFMKWAQKNRSAILAYQNQIFSTPDLVEDLEKMGL
jgi:hypothetical protein